METRTLSATKLKINSIIIRDNLLQYLKHFIYTVGEEQWKQFGITSWGYGCGVQGKPGVYAKVSTYTSWIRNLMDTYVPTEMNCQPPIPPENAYFVGDTSFLYSVGRTIDFSCNACYNGQGHLECTSTGTWHNTGACFHELPCSDPREIPNAIRSPDFMSSWSCGSSVSFVCRPGYQASGSTSSTCGENQEWNPPISTIICQATGCSDPGNVLNANRYPRYQNSFNEHANVTYTCHRCFRGGGAVTCSAGAWTGPTVRCSRMVCPSFPARSNLRHTSSTNLCGTINNFSCSSGFHLIGSEQTECVPVNGQTAQWTNQPPTCQPIATTPSVGPGSMASLVVIGGEQRVNGMRKKFYVIIPTGGGWL